MNKIQALEYKIDRQISNTQKNYILYKQVRKNIKLEITYDNMTALSIWTKKYHFFVSISSL